LAKGIANKAEVLNLEMLGGLGGDKLDIWDQGIKTTGNLVKNLQDAGNILNTKTQVHHSAPGSDAETFNLHKIPAVCVAWDYYLQGNHPFYHTAEDIPEKINKNVFAKATQLLAAASHLLANRTVAFSSNSENKIIEINKYKNYSSKFNKIV